MSTSSSDSLAARLSRIPTSSAKGILNDLGVHRVVISGPRLLVDGPGGTVAGRARTLRFLPAREDIKISPNGAINRITIDSLEPGEVLVMDSSGSSLSATIGDMLAMRASKRGAVAVVSDGVVRDLPALAGLGMAIYARGTHPDPSGRALTPWEANVPIACGGVTVMPGDWILIDGDSALVVPEALAEQVAAKGEEMNEEDEFSQKLLVQGWPLSVAYPISKPLRGDFEKYQKDGSLPTLAEFNARSK